MSLYLKYRPKTFEEVVGQEEAVQLLKAIIDQPKEKRPKVFLLGGSSGCGKTTLAVVFARAIGCDPDHSDFKIVDASKDRSIDNIRALCDCMGVKPMSRQAQGRVFVLDESHSLLRASQEALLKKCEDTPPDTYVFFCTTEPEALGKALLSRCKIITIKPLSPKSLYVNMKRIATEECITISDEDLQKIAKNSDGSARVSLQILENYMLNGGNADKAIAMVGGIGEELKADTMTLCRAIIGRKSDWAAVVDFCGKYKGQSESVRQAILGYLKACLLRSSEARERRRFVMLMECFIQPHYDCGDAALVYQLGNAFDLKD